MNKLIQKVVLKLEERARAKGNILYITERDDPTSVYLVRYPIFNNSLFGLYIHRFLLSDSADPHDHPFDFISYVVQGRYTELFYGKPYCTVDPNYNEYHLDYPDYNEREQGSIAFRSAGSAHVVQLDKELTSKDQYQEGTLTVILRGPRRRQWGFYKKLQTMYGRTIANWVHYTEYTPDHSYKTDKDGLK